MRPVTLTLVSQVADDDGISQTQALVGAGDLLLDGAFVSGGIADLVQPNYVTITSDADDSGITFTVIGTDKDGNALSETVTGANTAAVTTTHRFLTVTQISGSGATAGNVIAGTAAANYSEPCPMDYLISPFNVGLSFSDDGSTTSFTVQTCGDNPWDYNGPDDYNARGNWLDHPFMAAMTASANGNIAFAVMGVRLKSDQAGTDTGVLKITQAGH